MIRSGIAQSGIAIVTGRSDNENTLVLEQVVIDVFCILAGTTSSQAHADDLGTVGGTSLGGVKDI